MVIYCKKCNLRLDFTHWKIPAAKIVIEEKLQTFFKIPDPTLRSLPKATPKSCMEQMHHGDPAIADEVILGDRETYAAIQRKDPNAIAFQNKARPCGKYELWESLNGVRPGALEEDRFMKKPTQHLEFLYNKGKYMWVHCCACQTTVGIWNVRGGTLAEHRDSHDKLNKFLLTDKESWKVWQKMLHDGIMTQAALSVPAAPVPTEAKSDSGGSDSEEDTLCYHWEKNNPPATAAPLGFRWDFDDRRGWILQPTAPVDRRPR